METIKANTLDIKRALYIDNEGTEGETHSFTGLLREIVLNRGGEVRELMSAFSHQEELIELLKWCDCLCFESTFTRYEQVRVIGALLGALKPGTIIICKVTAPRVGESVYSNVMDLFKEKDIRMFNKFRMYEMEDRFVSLFDDGHGHSNLELTPFNFDTYIKAFDKRIERLKDKKKLINFKPTGRKVIIKDVKAVGEQWENLKPGMIVDELDCLEIEENIYWGIWVEGKSEPVKLINSDGYDEWTFQNPDAIALAIEILSMLSIRSVTIFAPFAQWLRHTPNLKSYQIHKGLSTLCDGNKRGNFYRMKTMVDKYCSTHKLFMDDSVKIYDMVRHEEKRRRIFQERYDEKNRLEKLENIRKYGIDPDDLKISEDEFNDALREQKTDAIIDFMEMVDELQELANQ